MKMENWVDFRGICTFFQTGIPGATHDITIAKTSIQTINQYLGANFAVADSGY